MTKSKEQKNPGSGIPNSDKKSLSMWQTLQLRQEQETKGQSNRNTCNIFGGAF